MTNYTEKNLESFIEAHLLESGYIKRESKDYDKSLGVDRELFLNFLHSTQAKTLQEFRNKRHKRARIIKAHFFTNTR
ncbi:hypothetical protein ACIMK4_001025 [Campylobacter upsaliensis]